MPSSLKIHTHTHTRNQIGIQVVGFADDERARGKPIQYADVYHSATRYGVGNQFVPIVLPRSLCWSFDRNRLLTGKELLRLQGQVPHKGKWTEPQLTDLAGNALLGFSVEEIVWVQLFYVGRDSRLAWTLKLQQLTERCYGGFFNFDF